MVGAAAAIATTTAAALATATPTIGLFNPPTINSIAASISAVSAMIAAGIALKSLRAHAAEVRLQRREKYYQQLVSRDSIGEVREFIHESRQILLEGMKARRLLGDDDPSIIATMQQLAETWSDRNSEFRRLLMIRIDAWGNDHLRSTVRAELEALEDEISNEINKLCVAPATVDFDSRLTARAAAILKLIMDHDPGANGSPS